MEFDNTLEVPLPPAEAWTLLLDIKRIAGCIPGAELTEVVDANTYKGKVGVRVGPVALTFAGQARIVEADPVAHKARVQAQGADPKGRGGTDAMIEFRLEPIAAGTRVLIHTDMKLSGPVAQYGRGAGMIQSVASQIIGQFGDALKAQLAQSAPASASTAPGAGPAAVPQAAPPAAKPISGIALILRALWHSISRPFRKN
jgi:uncharacterized protein